VDARRALLLASASAGADGKQQQQQQLVTHAESPGAIPANVFYGHGLEGVVRNAAQVSGPSLFSLLSCALLVACCSLCVARSHLAVNCVVQWNTALAPQHIRGMFRSGPIAWSSGFSLWNLIHHCVSVCSSLDFVKTARQLEARPGVRDPISHSG
jgi:hypothetical protein